MRTLFSYPWVEEAAAVVLISSVFNRLMHKYKERGYRFAQLEAGTLLQNFYLVTAALGVNCCGLGSIIEEETQHILDLEEGEEPLTALAVGP